MKLIGTFQIIGGKPHIVGSPELWKGSYTTFDDWEIPERSLVTVWYWLRMATVMGSRTFTITGRLEQDEDGYHISPLNDGGAWIQVELQEGDQIIVDDGKVQELELAGEGGKAE